MPVIEEENDLFGLSLRGAKHAAKRVGRCFHVNPFQCERRARVLRLTHSIMEIEDIGPSTYVPRPHEPASCFVAQPPILSGGPSAQCSQQLAHR
jgi:hypothetical protein